ncbi:hypothetical protein C6352_27200 [Bacillus thuringiensis]|uniref:hypothetical protein n=1 Tax=Bacillus thuringiensis TaxID=1428 RepID=UPI000D02FBAD|nr:hypothetical protein [Bacillus thuringiensis]PRT04315.1 hypothetical protein C6352_27200 [Bacillus thuringiensis]
MKELNPDIKKKVESNYLKLKDCMNRMTDFLNNNDCTLLYELDYRLKQDPELLEEFKKDPMEIIVRETGFTIPDGGFHFHYIDENNKYYPEERDAIHQLMFGKTHTEKPWGRIEIRFGIGPGSIAQCDVPGDG